MIDTINATGKVMVIYPLVLPVPPPLKGVGGTRALAHSIRYIYICMYINIHYALYIYSSSCS